MTTFTKTYFLCPTAEFLHPPPTGPICLGSIIRSTSSPQHSLNKGSVLVIPEPSTLPPIIETDWKKNVSSDSTLGFGIYAQFLQLATAGLPIGPEASVERRNQTGNIFQFDRVTTVAFEPSDEYVAEAVKAAPAIQTWLREPRQRFALSSSLYMVTGMKLVKGAKIRYSTSQDTAVKGNFGVDVHALGVTVGPKGKWSHAENDETDLHRDDEFVFAFRVKRLKFGRRVQLEEYTKGAFMSLGGNHDDEMGVAMEDVNGADFKSAARVPDDAERGADVYCVAT